VGATSVGGSLPGTRTFVVTGTAEAAPGTYPVTATVDDGDGGLRPVSFTITIAPPPSPLQTALVGRTVSQRARSATFRFTGSGGIAPRTFRCRLTGVKTTAAQRAWSTCRSGKTYRQLRRGLFVFHVRARDSEGTQDATPAKSSFRIR
jgi:hypothetical protein